MALAMWVRDTPPSRHDIFASDFCTENREEIQREGGYIDRQGFYFVYASFFHGDDWLS